MRVPLNEAFLEWAVGAVGEANLVQMITVAAAQTLADHALLTRLLAASYDENRSLLGPNVVLVVVAVERRPGGLGLGATPGDAREIVRRRVVWSSTLVDGLDV